ncbi:MAG: hypothetical protein P4L84_16095 [Isosphaeraceae bacterium]|nr:hypothetical protein [Isosphaeraceae bacterium]
MELDSVRGLKATLQQSVIAPLATSLAVKSFGLQAGPTAAMPAVPPAIALGVAHAPGGKNQFVLAVRVQKRGLENSPQIESIKKQAKGELNVQYIGIPTKRAAAGWTQKNARPLKIGTSIGHYKITAGTLGGFVRSRDDGSVLVLSNNHVLANENKGRKGDPILQRGAIDGGQNPADKVGTLLRFVRVKREGINLVDCAVATIDPGISFDARTLTGLGKLAGLGDAVLAPGGAVSKVGRTTVKTDGRISAFELDDVVVQFDAGLLRFNSQVEIEGAGDDPFSQGGDSGSLIVDAGHRAVGLLFAGGDQGGTNGKGLTYANPLRAVLDALKVDLVFA